MDYREFNRQLDELSNIISDGITYFSVWHCLTVEDDESAQALNRYRGLFLPTKVAMQNMALMQFAKVFDRHHKAISLRNLLLAAKGNREQLTPHITEEDLQNIENGIDTSDNLLSRLKCYRDQRLAHHDSFITKDSPIFYGEMQTLMKDTVSMYNALRVGHKRGVVTYEHLVTEVERHTSKVVQLVREDRERAIQKLKDIEKEESISDLA